MTFDNLTIHYKQVEQLLFFAERKIRDANPDAKLFGRVVRAQYDYYPYGLSWGRIDNAYNETSAASEFNFNEWATAGLDLNYYAARWYDPVLGRWHAPDPYEQFHSPYLAMCNDPANFIDPDGRSGIPWLQDFLDSDVGFFLGRADTLIGIKCY